jgi:hypothetical protein
VDDVFRVTSVALLDIESGEYRELFTMRGVAEDLVWSADGE